MKKVFIAIVLVGASALYIFSRTPAASSAPVATQPTTSSASNGSSGSSSGPQGTPPPPLPTPGPTKPKPQPATDPASTGSNSSSSGSSSSAPAPTKNASGYADGSYTGSTVDVYYGLVQVKATISGGRITDVAFLQYPTSHETSRYINSQAMPMLKQEAIAAQSANVNLISGATDTSLGFRKSLADALVQAKS